MLASDENDVHMDRKTNLQNLVTIDREVFRDVRIRRWQVKFRVSGYLWRQYNYCQFKENHLHQT